ncbi:soluble scavenger receptor cysteine-rich domain-containing protein SSC5D [Austrofundulus limnaeus]|uniref:Soluble scavenger receptor cysteine-rich domain-containing protein SSC5D n=1 Tax=Austrofundulus limnaeus TaxID=52670 RepID=A0A2I4D8V7_AUSLI|nr:PREDICTED: soluble scavenger receptor cysteine-rich domain-containing protein SSC5D-like [Austrofundulus limnaeus]
MPAEADVAGLAEGFVGVFFLVLCRTANRTRAAFARSSSPSSSPLCLSPQRTPPTPSRSPAERAHHAEKPGGKRKYKSRHLDSSARDPTWRLNGGRRRERRKERRKRREKERQEGQQENGALREESRKRSREDRSPSVEIIYEGTITSQPPGDKRRRKRHRRARHSSPPVIITLDSDSSDDIIRKRHSTSSSPLSSQQTIDFSDLPPLPLVHSAGVGGALDTEIGELPAEILDRGSDGSEVETAGPSAGRINISDNSDVDVENLEDEDGKTSPVDRQTHAEVPGGHGDISPSDKNLLRTILCDLNRISAAKQELSQNPRSSLSPDARTNPRSSLSPDARTNPRSSLSPDARTNPRSSLSPDARTNPRSSLSPDARTKTPQEDSPDETKHHWTSIPQSLDFQTCSGSAPSPPPLDVPPLLRRASPVRSYNRNTPPPLKHKDAGSPQRTATCPRDLLPHCSSDLDPGGVAYRQTIPPIETLQAHLRKVTPHFTPPETPHSSDLSCVSRGDAIKTTSPDSWVSPVDLHPPRSSGLDSNDALPETRRASPEPGVDLLSLIPSSGGQLDRRTAVNHAALSPSPVQHPDTFHQSKSSFKCPQSSDSAPQPPHANHLMRDLQIFEDLQNSFRVRSPDSNTNPEPGPGP